MSKIYEEWIAGTETMIGGTDQIELGVLIGDDVSFGINGHEPVQD